MARRNFITTEEPRTSLHASSGYVDPHRCLLNSDLDTLRAAVTECESDIQRGIRRRLPGNAAFLSDGRVLCRERGRGDSRYPYGSDGFNFWVNALGYMHGNRGLFFLFRPPGEGQEPPIAFYAGCCLPGEDSFVSHALLPIPFLNKGESRVVDRYSVFGHDAAFFVAETPELRSLVRVFVNQSRADHVHVNLSILVQNLTPLPLRIFTSAYMNPFCRHQFAATNEDRWFKQVYVEPHSQLANSQHDSISDASAILPAFAITTTEDVDRFHSISNYALVRRAIGLRSSSSGKQLPIFVQSGTAIPQQKSIDHIRTHIVAQQCTSRLSYFGSSRRGLTSAAFLTAGRFERDVPLTVFNDDAIVGDLLSLTLPVDSNLRADFVLSVPENREVFDLETDRPIGPIETDDALHLVRLRGRKTGNLDIAVHGPSRTDLDPDTFSQFLPYLKKQVAVCAMLKGYMSPSPNSLIGFRDVLQAIDGHLLDQPDESRTKLLEVLSHVLVNGRCPRQYSLPVNGAPGRADLRRFIDQGVWAISTVYNYVAVTGDATLLDEVVEYHRCRDSDESVISPSGERDTVLEHLLRIMDYLARHRDPDSGMVLAMYGDWNDALDGLGTSRDQQERFGTGVSAMTSLQVYQNCAEILELLSRYAPGRHEEHRVRFGRLREQVREGLLKYMVVRDGDQRRILHGWGDQRQYYVGSFRDSDGLARDGLTSNAFWVLSHMLEEDPSLKDDILAAFERLDSRYGLKTFEPGFAPDAPGVGRITKLPRGTAENGATYVHATAFAIAALFQMGEARKAWQQITKILPFSSHHKDLSHSPFVMPNSYVENLQLNLTGQSMNDWQTGSSNAMLKLLVRHVCGFQPEMDYFCVSPAAWHPFNSLELTGSAHGHRIHLVHSFGKVSQREVQLNGNNCPLIVRNQVSQSLDARIPYEFFTASNVNEISVTDPYEV